MACQNCGKDRLVSVNAKCDDRCIVSKERDKRLVKTTGYVPHIINIGSGDYLSFEVCLHCGQVQGDFPVPDPEMDER